MIRRLATWLIRTVGEKWAEADTRAASTFADPTWPGKSDD